MTNFDSAGEVNGAAAYCCQLLIQLCVAEGFVRLYRLIDNGQRLELVHKTAMGGIPGALAAFKGRLLVGVGPIVRLYDMGKKKLLRKSEYRRWEALFICRCHLAATLTGHTCLLSTLAASLHTA